MDKQKLLRQSKKIAYALMWCMLTAVLVMSLAFINKQENATRCSEVNVRIEPTEAAYFVDRDMILKTIRKDGNEKKIIGMNINSINTPNLETRLRNNPMIKAAEVYTDMNGKLYINTWQRRPVLRIINSFGESYYLDEDGLKMPVSPDYTAHVPVATGFIFEHGKGRDSAQSLVGKDLFKIATYVDKDTFWNAQIEQIFVTAESEFILIPAVGGQTIHFGSASEMEDKFRRLMLFYREAMNRVGWDTYSNIDVRFKNQIVCKKKNSL
jgi:cell division protein FtsQ